MKKNLLFLILTALIFSSTPPLFGAAGKRISQENQTLAEAAAPTKVSSRQERKAKRWEKRFDRMKNKLQKKMDRLKRKGKSGDRINLGTMLGLFVLLIGGLFIVLGLVIPAVGIVFLIIGIIIAFVGLLLWLLLGGITVDVS